MTFAEALTKILTELEQREAPIFFRGQIESAIPGIVQEIDRELPKLGFPVPTQQGAKK